ncbi:hypothetical protein GCM10010885_23050 [Alicyclobacillus cellulosilyticus]|uniref:Ribosomal RNA small subunit methyltransferase I n=1 Tax=Alicyclobacillus cellulosilyticus TaxID=1003997 RepID=A0A917KHZ4_9BACL|nr:16S rRNA (cytidine(1402)-2'-O)-methyltransferase [Alicyclobacillus cellulosilyticus]GGJ13147.1 hypothetical protein GCM10010885_23050 [Alicyclobacillus cellulosilyticus]
MLRIRRSTAGGPCLYVCSTPIGNLEDCSFRLLSTLRQADIIAAEDTRQALKLMQRHDIRGPRLVSYHEHNQALRTAEFVRWWQEGKRIALVCDAGTPGVSDPGAGAVAAAVAHGVPVIPIPGPSAVLAALVASGLPVQPFLFYGFLPRELAALRQVFARLDALPATLVFYESPHRLPRTLRCLAEVWPAREVVLAKELTKVHETFISGTPAEVLAYLEGDPPRGEYVLLVGPPAPGAAAGAAGAAGVSGAAGAASFAGTSNATGDPLAHAAALVRQRMAAGLSHAEAVRQVAAETGVRRKPLYQATLPQAPAP